jgi:hypothetical protein
MWLVQRACEVQLAAQAMGAAAADSRAGAGALRARLAELQPQVRRRADSFAALQRIVDGIDPGYRS